MKYNKIYYFNYINNLCDVNFIKNLFVKFI